MMAVFFGVLAVAGFVTGTVALVVSVRSHRMLRAFANGRATANGVEQQAAADGLDAEIRRPPKPSSMFATGVW